MSEMEYSFRAKIWKYKGPAGWYFVTLPKTLAARIRKKHGVAEEGWGRLKTLARIGPAKWDTAIWFDSKAGSYLLPIKASVRKAKGLKEKAQVQIALKIRKADPRLRGLKKIPKAQPHHWATTEQALLENLNEDLVDAFQKLKTFALSLGDQRVYAAGKAIMFSKEICYFFVRPKKSYLETVIFLSSSEKGPGFHSVKQASKAKYAHTFKLIHADQVEGDLTDAVAAAFQRV